MDKYYTPAIEEFHVGFEFESNTFSTSFAVLDFQDPTKDVVSESTPTWIKETFGLHHFSIWNSSYDFKMVLDDNRLRVKYLDKEDIESLGFEDSNDRGMTENYGYLFTKDSTHFESSKVQLRYWPTSNRVYIHDGQIIFNGSIKNKSELIILLKQLGINE